MRHIARAWDQRQLGDQRGKTVVVTGANSGVGFYTALELGRAGASVIAACRDAARGQEALSRLRREVPEGLFRLEQLDLAELAQVRRFADHFLESGTPLDLLINNAGVMAVSKRELTVDGFERQFGTNHLGHFALTGRLLPALGRSQAPRVVTLSSNVAYWGHVDLNDLQAESSYRPGRAYSASKLANLFFMLELGRRYPWLLSVAAHPGATHSNLLRHGGIGSKLIMRLIGQGADRGALPTLYAGTGEVASGEFYGPAQLFHLQGAPAQVKLPERARDPHLAYALWEASERLTGVRFERDAASPSPVQTAKASRLK